MPATAAQIAANRANSLKSTGPKTPEGKDASRANALKHGLTGAGMVLPESEAIEVQRRVVSYAAELNPTGDLGVALIRRIAVLSARMERCNEHETASLTDRVRRAEADFVPPEGVSPAEADRLRIEAGKLALFDPSKEATLARRYEQAAERGFFRALQEFRKVEKAVKVAADEALGAKLASFGPLGGLDLELEAIRREAAATPPRKPADRPEPVDFATLGGRVDVPFTVGRRR